MGLAFVAMATLTPTVLVAPVARAQGGPLAPPSASTASTAQPPAAPSGRAHASGEPAAPRAPSAPAVRESGARRRRANPAGGAFLFVLLVGAMVWYVVKRLRR